MFAGYLEPTPLDPLPYRVVVRRLGEIVRVQPVGSIAEGNRTLSNLLRRERESALEIDDPVELDD